MKCFSVGRLTLLPRTKTGGLQRRQRGVFAVGFDQDVARLVGGWDEMRWHQFLTSRLSHSVVPAACQPCSRSCGLERCRRLSEVNLPPHAGGLAERVSPCGSLAAALHHKVTPKKKVAAPKHRRNVAIGRLLARIKLPTPWPWPSACGSRWGASLQDAAGPLPDVLSRPVLPC